MIVCLSFRTMGASVRGSVTYSASGSISSGNLISRYSPGHMVLAGEGARSTNARRATGLGPLGMVDPYLYTRSSLMNTSRLAGRTAISFISMNGVPARISTSRFSIMRPSNLDSRFSRVNEVLVSQITCRVEEPSAWCTD